MSLGPIPTGRLKNPKDFDKWSSLSICRFEYGSTLRYYPEYKYQYNTNTKYIVVCNVTFLIG